MSEKRRLQRRRRKESESKLKRKSEKKEKRKRKEKKGKGKGGVIDGLNRDSPATGLLKSLSDDHSKIGWWEKKKEKKVQT